MRITPAMYAFAKNGNVFCNKSIINERIRRIENFRKKRPFDQWLVHLLKRVKHPSYFGGKL